MILISSYHFSFGEIISSFPHTIHIFDLAFKDLTSLRFVVSYTLMRKLVSLEFEYTVSVRLFDKI